MYLTLLSRAYCHLCDEMEAALRPMLAETPLDVIDIDAPENVALEARYGDAVPVLFAGDPAEGRVLSRHRLDAGKVRAALAENPEIR